MWWERRVGRKLKLPGMCSRSISGAVWPGQLHSSDCVHHDAVSSDGTDGNIGPSLSELLDNLHCWTIRERASDADVESCVHDVPCWNQ